MVDLRKIYFEELDSHVITFTVYKDGNKPILTHGTPMSPFKLSLLASKTSQVLNLEIKKKHLEPRSSCQCFSSSKKDENDVANITVTFKI